MKGKLLANPAAAAADVLLIVHKTPTGEKSHKEGRGRYSMYTVGTSDFDAQMTGIKI